MVFSSLVFISIFLPAVLLVYWLMPSIAGKNVLLLAVSLLFYAYGEPVYVFSYDRIFVVSLWMRDMDTRQQIQADASCSGRCCESGNIGCV